MTEPAQASSSGAAVIAKLEALEVERRARSEQRREEALQAQDPRESTRAFLASFTDSQQAVSAALGQLNAAGPAAEGDPEAARMVGARLDELAGGVFDMERRCAEAAYYLPTYDQKQCMAALGELKASIEAARTSLVPKRRFAFSKKVNRVKGTEAAAAPMPPPPTHTQQQAQQEQDSSRAGASAEASTSGPSERDIALVKAGHGYMGLRNQVLVLTASGAGDTVVLVDLAGCTVFLRGHMQALRMYGLRDTRVFTGPITGACFVDDVRGCRLCLASYQVRIHSTHDTDFYLRVKSRPIIEHTQGARFAPYAPAFAPGPATLALLQQHGLGEETGMWDKVDDFGWIKSMQSPNWSVIPEAERETCPASEPAAGEGQGSGGGSSTAAGSAPAVQAAGTGDGAAAGQQQGPSPALAGEDEL